ncbi:dihydrofolate reductase family protein [Kribbella italica]|uniref:Dihydrofolate reductase n=1 Tax=Kribbella italica TaxID=1540520 RepID=A0A7W9JFC7_9ACTN|nr:dihydrofolate reductase family protein [Kribbella italica]MBB5841114.1 dihydrofolate reductase [Kribbella italica]
MSSTVLYMSMSLDGFIAGPNETFENGLGDGGARLHEWGVLNDPDSMGEADRAVYDDFMATGAVVAGRGTFEPAGGWNGDHHDGIQIYILSRHTPAAEFAGWPNVHYVDDLEYAVAEAKKAAGAKNVMVHGAGLTQRLLAAGLLDEIQIHLVPVLFGQGRRLFDHLGPEQIQLEPLQTAQGRDATHLRYRVLR